MQQNGNNIIELRMMQTDKQKFNKHYIECIMKNHNYITPTKSCDLGTSSQRVKKLPNQNILKQFNTPKYQFISIGKINKIFEPSWRAETKKDTAQATRKNQELIDIFLRKNQEIAASLIKQKKSMSDMVYHNGKQSKYTRYSQDSQSRANNLDSKIKFIPQKIHILPKIASKGHTNSIKKSKESIQFEETEIVIVNDKRLQNGLESIQTQNTKMNGGQDVQLQYSDVTNINIKKFLKLKQHTYDVDEKTSFEPVMMKKKKMQTHKKRMQKKQKQELKNSLEAYLETKMVTKQQKQEKVSTKKDNQVEQDQQNKNLKEGQILSKSEPQNQEVNNLLNKINNRSLPKSLKKIGTNAKISKKNIFNLQQTESTIYEQKIKSFRQYIFLIKMAHNIFQPVQISDQPLKNENKFKFFVGKGNNRQLIKALMKRRFWWVETEDINEANFIWTQLKVNAIFEKQTVNCRTAAQFYQMQTEGIENEKVNQKKQKNGNIYKASLPENEFLKIFTSHQYKQYQNYIRSVDSLNINPQKLQNYENRRKFLPFLKTNDQQKNKLKVHNHFEFNYFIGNKKALYYNLKRYCQLANKNLFDIVPLTFHIGQDGVTSQAYKEFIKQFKAHRARKDSKNIWIIKPGQNSNRGNGISVFDQLYQLNRIIGASKKATEAGPHTYIVQKYIQRPLLYKGRKFDIRHYMLASRLHGKMRLYFYGEGYVRTSSSDFDLSEIGDNQIHLTNDAIQKYSQSYGKYEEGNKISYTELQRYIDVTYPNRKYSLSKQFYPKIKEIALQTFKACYLTMDPQSLSHNFEIFGLDFMIDQNFHVWLIEVNTNPCLELSSNLLSRIIPTMVEHSFRLTIDPLFPPPCHYSNSIKHLVPDSPLERQQYQLIFDESRDGKDIQILYKDEQNIAGLQNVEEDQDTFDNDGKEQDIQIQ